MLALRLRRPRQVLVATNAEELVANRRDPNGNATPVYETGGPAPRAWDAMGLAAGLTDRISTLQMIPPTRQLHTLQNNLPDSPPPGYVGTHLYLLPEQTVMHGTFDEDSSMQQAPQ